MSNETHARIERRFDDLVRQHETDGATFLDTFCQDPLARAFESDLTLQNVMAQGYTFRSMAVLKAERDRHTEGAKALMSMLADYNAGNPQTRDEHIVGRWLSHVVREAVQRQVDDEEARGDFHEPERPVAA